MRNSSGKKIVLLKACCLVKLVPLQSSYILAAEEAVLLLYKESQWRRIAIVDEHFKANKPSLAIRPVFGISGCSGFNVLAITSKM